MTDLDTRWAWSQIEAAADESLPGQDERRMRAALASDPELRRALESARELRRSLRRLGRKPVPWSLYARLSRIAEPAAGAKRTKASVWSWASAAAAASTVAAALILLTQPEPVRDDPRTAALRDFELAMAYLHKGYTLAGEHMKRAMERELKEALGFETDGGGGPPSGSNGG